MKLSLALVKHKEIEGVQEKEAITPWIFYLGIKASLIVSFTALSFYPRERAFWTNWKGIWACHRIRLVGLEKISLAFSSNRTSIPWCCNLQLFVTSAGLCWRHV